MINRIISRHRNLFFWIAAIELAGILFLLNELLNNRCSLELSRGETIFPKGLLDKDRPFATINYKYEATGENIHKPTESASQIKREIIASIPSPIPTSIPTFVFQELDERQKAAVINRLDTFTDTQWEEEAWRLAELNLENNTYLIMSTLNYGHFEFAVNWIISMKRNNFHKFLLFCYDADIYKALAFYSLTENVVMAPKKWLSHNVSLKELPYGNPLFKELTHTKLDVSYKILEKGYTVFFTDVDLVWLSPTIVQYIDYIFRYAELLYMVDRDNDVNTGFYVAKPRTKVKSFFQHVIKLQETEKRSNQVVLNEAILNLKPEQLPKLQPLDELLFMNGRGYYLREMNKVLNIQPLVVHANYIVGKEKKRARLESSGMWYKYEIKSAVKQ